MLLPFRLQAPDITLDENLTVPNVSEELEKIGSEWSVWQQRLDREALIALVVSLIIFLLLAALSKPIARGLLRIFYALRKRSWSDRLLATRRLFEKPLARMLVGLAGLGLIRVVTLPPTIAELLGKIFETLTIIMLFVIIYEGSKVLGVAMMERRQKEAARAKPDEPGGTALTLNATRYIGTIIRAIIIVLGGVTVISIWFPNITGVLAGIGIGGLVLALAAQDTAANIFASIAIMLDHPFRIGDWIETEDVAGTVEKIGLRSTRIRAIDESLVTVPNSTLGSVWIVNGTTRTKRSLIVPLTFRSDADREKLMAWIERMRRELPAIEGVGPDATSVYLTEISDIGIKVELRYTTPASFDAMLKVKERVNRKILETVADYDLRFAVRPVTVQVDA